VTQTEASPGYFGTYDKKYPSPRSTVDWPSSGANIGWVAANIETFGDISKTIPGSIGPAYYYTSNVSPF